MELFENHNLDYLKINTLFSYYTPPPHFLQHNPNLYSIMLCWVVASWERNSYFCINFNDSLGSWCPLNFGWIPNHGFYRLCPLSTDKLWAQCCPTSYLATVLTTVSNCRLAPRINDWLRANLPKLHSLKSPHQSVVGFKIIRYVSYIAPLRIFNFYSF